MGVVEDLTGSVDDLSTKVDAVGTLVADLNTAVTTLQGQVASGADPAAVEAQVQRIQALSAQLANLVPAPPAA